MDIFDKLINDFHDSSAWLEFSVLLGSLLLAYLLTQYARRHAEPGNGRRSVWIGSNALDGALLPLLALIFVCVAQEVVASRMPVFWLRVAMSLLASLALIRFVARVLSKVFPNSAMVRFIERIFSWLVWGVAVLHSLRILPEVLEVLESVQFTLGKQPINLLYLIEGTLAIGLMMVAVLWLSTLIEQKVINPWVSDLSMRRVAMNLARSVLITIGLLVGLSTIGVDLTALSVMGGALGVGLGFGMQKIASNYVSGFLVLIERALRIGDNVRVDGFEGRITDIKTRFTVIKAANGRESIVPNETLITQRVENLTQADRQLALSTTIVVGMDSDAEQVKSILLSAAAAQPRVLTTPAPFVTLVDFVEQGLQFMLSYYISDPRNGLANVRSEVNLAVLKGLRDAGVALPGSTRLVRIAPEKE
ncbi:mechanosensitive ion channel family protein [Comamonas composti]|uniref:mechanosensitive ion channel family protein n=1 Tax=Comamonas composti TaxID=408558 RepID=UPI0003FD6134|nr:mechanosensitive ion channel domain-containing protein [Comamonas composti]